MDVKKIAEIQQQLVVEQEEVEKQLFTATSSLVTVEMKGNKELKGVKIRATELATEDIELLEDMIVIAINDVSKQIDAEIEKRVSKLTKGLPGF